jgi:DNA-binding transcriptional MerR regulator
MLVAGREVGMPRTVGEVARLANVSVRTLHHYDEIGLLSPSRRSEAGYRLYAHGDLERLQRILGYRELGFELGAIRTLLEDGDDAAHLRRQAEAIDRRLRRLEAMRATLHRTMEARRMGVNLTAKEMLEVFGDEDPTRHAVEAEERWGDDDAWAQSQERTKRYGKDDWLRIKEELEAVEARVAAALAAGVPADAEEAMDAAEAHRRHIGLRFYDCSYEMHRNLAEMYVADPRFAEHYERRAEGLAAYLRDAILANADRHGAAT